MVRLGGARHCDWIQVHYPVCPTKKGDRFIFCCLYALVRQIHSTFFPILSHLTAWFLLSHEKYILLTVPLTFDF